MFTLNDFIYDPACVLYLPLGKRDGAKFPSDDAHGHLCTVTGATWSPSGRKFNGTSDIIVINNNSIIDTLATGIFSIFVSFKKKTSTSGLVLLANGDDNIDWNVHFLQGAADAINCQVVDSSPAQKNINGVRALKNGGTYCGVLISDNIQYQFYLDGLKDGISVAVTTKGLRAVNQELTIGAKYNNNLWASGYDDIIRTVIIFNKAVAPIEVMNLTQLIKGNLI